MNILLQQLATLFSNNDTVNCMAIGCPTNTTSDISIWPFQVILLIGIAIIWTLLWKALALWHAARNGNKPWFIILLLVNSLGILEIIYLAFIAKIKFRNLRSCKCIGKCKCK